MGQEFSISYLYENDWKSLSELREAFEWTIPETLNAVGPLCDDWATDQEDRVALYYEDSTQNRSGSMTFSEVRDASM